MTIVHVALDGEVGFALADRAAVDGQADDLMGHRAARLGAHRLAHRLQGPQRAHAACSASAAFAASWSLNGKVLSPTICPVSCPLPAITSASPGCNSATAARMASARSPISRAPGAARHDRRTNGGGIFAARIVVGDDDAVGALGGDLAHDRALAGVAVAAGAEHDDQLAPRVGPHRDQDLFERIGFVRIVDEDRRPVLLAHQFQPSLRAFELFERGERLGRVGSGADGEAGGDQRVLDLEFADQRQPQFRALAAVLDCHDLAEAVDRGVDQANFAALATDRDDAQAALAGHCHNRIGMLVIGDDHRRTVQPSRDP